MKDIPATVGAFTAPPTTKAGLARKMPSILPNATTIDASSGPLWNSGIDNFKSRRFRPTSACKRWATTREAYECEIAMPTNPDNAFGIQRTTNLVLLTTLPPNPTRPLFCRTGHHENVWDNCIIPNKVKSLNCKTVGVLCSRIHCIGKRINGTVHWFDQSIIDESTRRREKVVESRITADWWSADYADPYPADWFRMDETELVDSWLRKERQIRWIKGKHLWTG